MGISLATAVHLYRTCRARELSGVAVIFGKQDLDFGLDNLLVALSEAGELSRSENRIHVPPEQMAVFTAFRDAGRLFSRRSDPDAAPGARVLSDDFLFAFIGFTTVRSVDYEAFEGADVIHDLNQLGLAEKLPPASLVYDGGTMEHVFHTPNLLRNAFDALAVGGYVLHHSPSNNFIDHGFYQFSPTLFWDYYHANNFEDIEVRITTVVGGVPFSREYRPSSFQKSSPSSGSEPFSTECWARKTEASTGGAIPQQGMYVRVWDELKRDP